MTREELQSAIQDFWDEAFHYSKHKISDTSKAIALECMIDASNRENPQPSTNADRIRAMSDEDLASMLFAYKECGKNCIMSDGKRCYQICDDESTILKWIQQPAEEER